VLPPWGPATTAVPTTPPPANENDAAAPPAGGRARTSAVAARPRVVSERTQFALQAALLVVLLALGLLIAAQGNGYTAQLLFNVALSVLLASGWNVIGGMTGYVSFGQVSFFGLGAYAAAIGVLHLALPWLIAALAATAAATALAIPLGLIMLRLNGIFFALGMFGLARILQIAANALNITGGPMGTTVPAAEGGVGQLPR